MGMTYKGMNTALMRFLDNDHVEIDEAGDSASGSAQDLMKGVFS
jgi:hypothetical protein